MLDSHSSPFYSPVVSDADNRAPCASYSADLEKFKFGHGGPRAGAGRPRRISRDHPPAQALASAQPRSHGRHWRCVQTGPGARDQINVDVDLRLAGFEVFNPSLFKPAVPPRRLASGTLYPGRAACIVALFPRYLFVRFDEWLDDWRAMRRITGLHQVFLAAPDRPAIVPAPSIDALRALCTDNDCIYPPHLPARPLTCGTQVRIREGHPLASHTGLCEASDRRRVRLLMDIMGRAVRVSLPCFAVEPLEASCSRSC